MRRSVVRLITFVGGLYFLLEFLLPPASAEKGNFLTPYLADATNFAVVVSTMAFLLGPFNLVRSHLKTIFARKKGWLEGCVFLLSLATAIVAKSYEGSEEGKALGMDVLHDAMAFGITTAFFASSMALLAFYLVSAAHRALRLNNAEAGLMLVAAAIVLLGQVPVGDWLTGGLPVWLQFRSWTEWILIYPNAGVQRAVLIGACGGALAASLRHWLGLGRRAE